MKKYIRTTVLIVCLAIPAWGVAQGVNREVIVDKEYNPMIQDANKINTLPPIEEKAPKKSSVLYQEESTPFSQESTLTLLPLAKVDTVSYFQKNRGYAQLTAGNNILGLIDAGYLLLQKEKSRWDINAFYHGKYHRIEFEPSLINWKYNHHFGAKTEFSQRYKGGSFETGISYDGHLFNYQIPITKDEKQLFPDLGKQFLNRVSAHMGISGLLDQEYRYSVKLKYDLNDFKYANRMGINDLGKDSIISGTTEHLIQFEGELSKHLIDKAHIGLKLDINSLFYQNNNRSNYAAFDLTPYYELRARTYKLHLGVNLSVSPISGVTFRIAPDVTFDWNPNRTFGLTAYVKGGRVINNYEKLLSQCLYVDPSERPSDEYIPVDAYLALQTGIIPFTKIKVFGGYKYFIDKAFLASTTYYTPAQRKYIYQGSVHYSQEEGSQAYLGGQINYSGKSLDINLQGQYNWWYTKANNTKAWAVPAFESSLDINYRWNKKLTLTAQYQIELERYAKQYNFTTTDRPFSQYIIRKMTDIHNVNLSLSYQFNKKLYGGLGINNLLNLNYNYDFGQYKMKNQGYEIYPGITSPGATITATVGIRF